MRKTIFKKKIFENILKEIAEGKSLISILKRGNASKRKKDYPDYSTFFRWIEKDNRLKGEVKCKKLCDRYTQAKEDSADYLADEMLDIADNCFAGTKNKLIKTINFDMIDNPEVRVKLRKQVYSMLSDFFSSHHVLVHQARLRVNTRKWIASKLKPKKYSERRNLDLTSKDKELKFMQFLGGCIEGGEHAI